MPSGSGSGDVGYHCARRRRRAAGRRPTDRSPARRARRGRARRSAAAASGRPTKATSAHAATASSVYGHDLAVADPRERGQPARRVGAARAEGPGDGDVRVAREQADQFLAGVAGGADDGGPEGGGGGIRHRVVVSGGPRMCERITMQGRCELCMAILRVVNADVWLGDATAAPAAISGLTVRRGCGKICSWLHNHESLPASGHPRNRRPRGHPVAGGPAPAPPRPGHRRHAGHPVARPQGTGPRQARRRRCLPASRRRSRDAAGRIRGAAAARRRRLPPEGRRRPRADRRCAPGPARHTRSRSPSTAIPATASSARSPATTRSSSSRGARSTPPASRGSSSTGPRSNHASCADRAAPTSRRGSSSPCNASFSPTPAASTRRSRSPGSRSTTTPRSSRVTLDLGQGRDLTDIRERALSIGAVARARARRPRGVRARLLPAGAAGRARSTSTAIPLSTSLGRPLIAKHLVQIAEMEGATAIAHGCTGKGNDQVRLDVVGARPASRASR